LRRNMKATNLIGRPVLIDWPVRWKGADDEAAAKADAAKSESRNWFFGRTGEIVGTQAEDSQGRDLLVKLDDGQIVALYSGAVTVTGDAPDSNKQVVQLLKEIREVLKDIAHDMARTSGRTP